MHHLCIKNKFAGCWGRRRDCGWSRARQGASDGCAAHHGLLLEFDADTAAHGVSERLLGLVGEVVVLETVNVEEQSGYIVREQACQRAG